jgi:cytochrome c oxidase cbb3-type subunit 2
MKTSSISRSLAGALMVAGVYAYFLLFSQFAFLEIVQSHVADQGRIKMVLSLMAAGGVLASVYAARGRKILYLRYGLATCIVASGSAALADGMISLMLISLMMGLALGLVTVSLAATLPKLLGAKHGCWWTGLGTGLGYAVCNVPSIFQASPTHQAWISCAFPLIAWCCFEWIQSSLSDDEETLTRTVKFSPIAVVVIFLALVWMDSGAFYIIQHAEDLKKATWGAERLWINAALHFFAAVVAGGLLAHRHFRAVILAATLPLCAAAWWVNDRDHRALAAILYPIGVSCYSTALVCWPGFFSPANQSWKRAAWVFALAGWIGSGLGIGMAENLHRVPAWFILTTLGLITSLLVTHRWHHRAALLFLCGIAALTLASRNTELVSSSAIERGKAVYLAEGCLNCHSQYLRPGQMDTTLWGPPAALKTVLAHQPVVIGNRRQGPDLTHVAGRRSAAWLKEHFIDPRALAPDSPMPSYRHLFDDSRGDDLIAYLQRDIEVALPAIQRHAASWKPQREFVGNLDAGKKLYLAHCAICHGQDGHGDGPLAKRFLKAPANLAKGPWIWSAARDDEAASTTISRIIRFGIPGTDMPGHEVWTEAQVQDVAAYLLAWRKNNP